MRIPARFAFVVLAGLTLAVLTGVSCYRTAEDQNLRTLMRIGLEDAAGRVMRAQQNLRDVMKFNDATILTKARVFAQLVAVDSALLTDTNRLAAVARTLDVDELHVSDGKGVLVACVPSAYVGYDMSTSDQTRPFMAAIGNRSFELVQEPREKGLVLGDKSVDSSLFQYAGVARIDKPGIVQVGQLASRVQEAHQLAEVGSLLSSMRIGPAGRVEIASERGLPPADSNFRYAKDKEGRRCLVLESSCGGYRLTATAPASGGQLARAVVCEVLVVVDIIFLLLLVCSGPVLLRVFRQDVDALRVMFGSRFATDGAFRRAAGNPVTIACASAFLLALGLTWLMTSHASRSEARARLRAAAADMHGTVSDCADSLMFYQGQAIVNHYREPQAMTVDTVQMLMDRYGLDELNVVDKNGIVLAGALADVGYDMGSNPKSARFNCLLAGARTYSQDFRAPIEDPDGEKRKYAGVAFPWPKKGYVQIGFSEGRLRNGIDFWFEEAALKAHVGERGYFIIADNETGRIKSCGRRDPETGAMTVRKGLTLAGIGFDAPAAPKDREAFFEATLFGEKCLCLSEVLCYHRIVCAIPLSEVTGGGRRTVLVSMAVLFAVFVLVVFFMTKLTNLVSSLREKERVERERQLKDLTLARTIQASSLPLVFPDEADYRIFARMDTAREVGGDFYDFCPISAERVLFLVADVSGKGVPAALFMMRAKALLRAAVAAHAQDLAAAVAEANNALSESNDAEMFVTAWVGVYDRRTGEVDFVNAGHNPPLIRRANGAVEWVRERSGLVLAAMPDATYRIRRLVLAPGDSLLLYTDGVTEAMNAAGDLYGEARLERTLSAAGNQFVSDVRADLTGFVAGAEQSDDVTILAFDVKTEAFNQRKANK